MGIDDTDRIEGVRSQLFPVSGAAWLASRSGATIPAGMLMGVAAMRPPEFSFRSWRCLDDDGRDRTGYVPKVLVSSCQRYSEMFAVGFIMAFIVALDCD